MSEEFDIDEAIFTIIANAGEARSKIFQSLSLAEQGSLVEARNCYIGAEKDLQQAHREQTKFIQRESGGEVIPISMLFLHAQDHLMTAISEKNLAEKILFLHEELSQMSKRINKLENKYKSEE